MLAPHDWLRCTNQAEKSASHTDSQCKHHDREKTIPPKEIQDEVDKALTFDPPLERYAILTTAKATVHDHNMALAINNAHRKKGLFIVELFAWSDIEELLDEYPDIAKMLTPVTNAHVVELNQTVTQGLSQLATQIESSTSTMQRMTFDAEIDEAEAYEKR